MPRYDYRCTACENEFELTQSFSEAGAGTCPACSGAGRRVYHAVPVIYKGSGFYTTDYGRPKPPAENGGKESTDKESADKKPASKSSTETSSSSTESKASSGEGSSGAAESKSESSTKTTSESGS